MAVVRREVSDRTLMGKILKWLFILFNLFMIYALVSGLIGAGSYEDATVMSDAELAGRGIGVMLGLGFLGIIWVIGDIILGTLVLLTRRKKIIETEE